MACGRFEHQKSKYSLFKIKTLRKFQGKYFQELQLKILTENGTVYYNLYKLALWNLMKHQKKIKSVILFGEQNLNFFLKKPFKRRIWFSMHPIADYESLWPFSCFLSGINYYRLWKGPKFPMHIGVLAVLSSFFPFWLQLNARWLEVRKTNERKTNYINQIKIKR